MFPIHDILLGRDPMSVHEVLSQSHTRRDARHIGPCAAGARLLSPRFSRQIALPHGPDAWGDTFAQSEVIHAALA
jgi:hypothetical protein